VSADRPQDPWRVALPRVNDVEYGIEHRGDHLFFLVIYLYPMLGQLCTWESVPIQFNQFVFRNLYSKSQTRSVIIGFNTIWFPQKEKMLFCSFVSGSRK